MSQVENRRMTDEDLRALATLAARKRQEVRSGIQDLRRQAGPVVEQKIQSVLALYALPVRRDEKLFNEFWEGLASPIAKMSVQKEEEVIPALCARAELWAHARMRDA